MNYTLYSQRLDAYKKHDGWIYDRFPATFRTQLVYIVRDLPVKEPFWQRFNQWFEREKDGRPKFILFRNRAIRSAKSSNTVWNNSTILNFSI